MYLEEQLCSFWLSSVELWIDIDSKSSEIVDKSSSSDDWSVWEVLEAVELVAATEGFFKLAVEPLDEPPIRNDEPKNKHK